MRPIAAFLFLFLLQSFAGLFLGFAVAYTLGFDRARDLLLIGLGNGFGVWGIGAVAIFNSGKSPSVRALVATVAGALLGVLLILSSLSFSFGALLLPLAGALIGYYLGSD